MRSQPSLKVVTYNAAISACEKGGGRGLKTWGLMMTGLMARIDALVSLLPLPLSAMSQSTRKLRVSPMLNALQRRLSVR